CSEIHSLIHRGHEFWYVNKRDIVNDLRSTDTANNFLDSIASRKYDPDDPVHKADRDKQYFSSAFVEKNELLYLIVRYLSIDKELYKKAEMSANFLMIILRIGISGTIGVILQIFAQNFLYSSVAILISFLLIGGLVSIEQHFWGKSTKWKNKKAMKKYRKKVAKAHERLLTDHIFLRNSAISQIEALRDEFDIGYALSYREDELLEADIEILLSPPHRNC
ncbi:MAG: hypothetical protein KAS73_00520, partial [Candidatus Sabulitectum sp.]|nr:hypothetical protein [Candidatus Sabulitectum sp.]